MRSPKAPAPPLIAVLRRLSRAGAWAVLLVAAGCESGIDVEDDGVFFPTVRASKRMGEEWTIGAIADYAEGSGTEAGSVGTPIVIGGESFPGPVDVEFDLATLRIEARARHEISPHWLVDGFFGAAIYYADVTVSAGSARGEDDQLEAGPVGGGRIGWRPVPRLQVYGEVYFFYPIPDGIVMDGGVELGVEYHATGPVSVLGGWRFRDLDLVLDESDWEFEWSGPFFGVAFDF